MALSLSGDGTLSGVDIAASGLGRVLQVVRATDTTQRTTTSTTFVDVTGMSVTISPTKSTSAIILISTFHFDIVRNGSTNTYGEFRFADSSNNAISGAEIGPLAYGDSGSNLVRNLIAYVTLIGYATPATTSATTYKLQFSAKNASSTATINNNTNTGQIFAIEVAA